MLQVLVLQVLRGDGISTSNEPTLPNPSIRSRRRRATPKSRRKQLIQPFVNKVYCKGWGTVYVTDDLFDVNPFDNPPTFWHDFIAAAQNIPTADSCGDGALKVLAPLLGTDPAGEVFLRTVI